MPKVERYREPEELSEKLSGLKKGHVRALGVDLGNNCGVAYCDFDPRKPIDWDKIQMVGGQLDLKVAPYETGPLRHVRLKHFLFVLSPSIIGFEDVKNTPSEAMYGGKKLGIIVARIANAAELLGGLKITMTTWAEEQGVPAVSWSISEIKKWATGKGNAGKPAMIKAANKKFRVELDPENFQTSGTDNIADAMHACAMTVETYAKGLK